MLNFERIMKVLGRTTCNSTCDGTGVSRKHYGRWLDVRTSKRKKRKKFAKLHAHIATDADVLFFPSVRVTNVYKRISKQLPHVLRQKSRQISIGEMPLDSIYLARRNALLIANQGETIYIVLRKDTASALSLGYPTRNTLVQDAWEDEEEYEVHYYRKSLVEGVLKPSKRGTVCRHSR